MMGFFGGDNRRPTQNVASTAGGVPNDAIRRLRRMAGDGGKPLFTSDLSVSEFVLLKQMQCRPLGLVLGSSIYHVGLQLNPLQNAFGNGEITVLTESLYRARELAIGRLIEEAAVLGADGVVGVRLDVGSYPWAGEALEFSAVGTAIRLDERTRAGREGQKPFTSGLNVQDFYKLYVTGYLPSELVLGNCVYGVAYQNPLQLLGQFGRNVEIPTYTQAIYEARELAMGRMQAEAEAHGAEGIVGVTIVERNHNWQTHVIEFFTFGTSIVPRPGYAGDGRLPQTPTIAVNLDG